MGNRNGKNAIPGKVMSALEMGNLLGLKKTERYYLIHKGLFKTVIIHGKMWVDIESFEEWYANQDEYRKVNGEAPGAGLRTWSYSARDAAGMLGVSEGKVYALIRDGKFETVDVNFRKRILKQSFDEWCAANNKYICREKKHYSEKQVPQGRKYDKYITIKEAAQIAGISRQAISKHLLNNHFDHIYKRGIIRISRTSFESWLNKRRE